MDPEGLSYLHVLKANETENIMDTLHKTLQEAAENNSPDVDTLWKIIMHLWTVIDELPYRSPTTPLQQIPMDSILSPEDIRTQKYASFIQAVYSWLVIHRQTNTQGQALAHLGRLKPGLDAEVEAQFDKSARAKMNPDGSQDQRYTGYIKSVAHHYLVKGVIQRCADRGKYLMAPVGYTLSEDGTRFVKDEKWEREEEERKEKEEEQKEQGKKEKKGEQEKKSEKVEEKGKRSEKDE